MSKVKWGTAIIYKVNGKLGIKNILTGSMVVRVLNLGFLKQKADVGGSFYILEQTSPIYMMSSRPARAA